MKVKIAAFWVLRILLGLVFLAAGLPKVRGLGGWTGRFARWGYPPWFVVVVGVAELCGAVMLLIPQLTKPAVGGLSLIMLGALGTHLRYGETDRLIPPLVLLALLVLVARGRFRN